MNTRYLQKENGMERKIISTNSIFTMADKKDIYLNSMLLFILIVKVVWMFSIFSKFVVQKYYAEKEEYIHMLHNFEDLLHDIFTLTIGLLLIYLYNHLTPREVCIKGHTKLYLYSFGILSLVGTLQKEFHKYYFGLRNILKGEL